ncbi:secreted phospho 24 [Pelobates cultripes]|uniref:Secreted phosphoprotein 24 n=1 Tax=Pelobates cultripes TaxID=61616 RepID=A0AAD1SN04_PELCU|nr:secreted phospho 24 [Pelobates cultripes]
MKSILGILLLYLLGCSGYPAFDYDEDVIRSALNASLARLNDESRGTKLLRITRSRVMRVSYPRVADIDLEIIMEFSVRETICNKNFARDPTTCDFRIGSQMEASCRSQVLISNGKTRVLNAYCPPSSGSSESHSSEELLWRIWTPARSFLQDEERFPSQWHPFGRKNQKPNPRWEEEYWDSRSWQ